VFGVELFFDVLGDALAAVVDNLHPETLGAAGDGLPDATEANDAESFSPNIGTAVLVEIPALPVPCPDILIGFDDAARDSEHERPGEVGGGFVEDAGSVGNQYATARAGGDVDVVVANGYIGDDAELGGGTQRVVADAFGKKTDEALFIFDTTKEFVFGRALLLGPELAVADGL